MRRAPWMLMLLAGCLIGCGGSSLPKTTVDASTAKEPDIPVEVVSLFEQGELARAIDVLSTLIEKTPRDTGLFALRATAQHRLGHHAEALTDLDRAIGLSDRDAKLYNNRGYIRMGLEQFDPALQDFDKATELAPKYKNAFNNRGLLRIAQKRYSDALTEFNRAIEIDNNYVDAYNNRGFAEFESGQIERALADFNQVIRLNPEYVNAFNNRGLLRARVGDFENAAIDFTNAMMLEPLNPKYYEHRREVYLKQGAVDKAIADEKKIAWLIEYHRLTAAVAATADPVDELTDRAKHWVQINNLERAMMDLDRALSIAPRSAESLVVRASLHLRQKAISNARSDAEAALAIESNQEAYSILGDAFLSQGDFDRAIENFARTRRVDPNVAAAYYGKAKVLTKQGQSEEAKDSLERALALDPDIESRLR